jgi:RNA polymerase primary sigma factor
MADRVFTSSFSELGRDPLLTPAEELELSRLIQAGMEPDATEKQKRRAHRAKQRMVAGNIRLAVNVAQKYTRRCKHLDIEDLTQEAVFGLHRAAEKFDPLRGYKFSTYAYGWIRQSIMRAINNLDNSIRVPIHAHDQATRFRTAALANPSLKPDEIAAIADSNLAYIELWVRARGVCSLNKIVQSSKDNSELMDFQASEEPQGTLMAEMGIELGDLIEFIDCMDPREAFVLRNHFGLDGAEPMTLADIGRQIGTSRERTRVLKERACRKVRIAFGSVERVAV